MKKTASERLVRLSPLQQSVIFHAEPCPSSHHFSCGDFSFSSSCLPGRHDSSGIRLYYTETLRRYDAGIMELGLVYSPVMAIPPGEDDFVLTGYCTDKCTQLVSAHPLCPSFALEKKGGKWLSPGCRQR